MLGAGDEDRCRIISLQMDETIIVTTIHRHFDTSNVERFQLSTCNTKKNQSLGCIHVTPSGTRIKRSCSVKEGESTLHDGLLYCSES